jgi:hypothetical protein
VEAVAAAVVAVVVAAPDLPTYPFWVGVATATLPHPG